jgi:hypothetical protein
VFFTNKHVVVALIVAPVLSILAWYAVGEFAGEKAEPATRGDSYPLVEKSNCRYESGSCDLENGDFKLTLQVTESAVLTMQSAHPLQGVLVSVGDPVLQLDPGPMHRVDPEGLSWRLPLEQVPGAGERIRLVAQTRGNTYFADASTLFIRR